MEGYKHALLFFIVIALIFAIAIIITQHDFLVEQARKLWNDRKSFREENNSPSPSGAIGQRIGEGRGIISPPSPKIFFNTIIEYNDFVFSYGFENNFKTALFTIQFLGGQWGF
jgi:hypothetical protein